MAKTKIYCCVSAAHRPLMDRYFLPSVPKESCEVVVLESLEAGAGNYMDASYLACLTQKTELIAQSVQDNLGETIIWSDVDVQFFRFDPREIIQEMNAGKLDALFQELMVGARDACGGFYAIRCSEKTLKFFRKVVEVTRDRFNGFDQDAINLLLHEGFADVRHGFLPPRYYARIHGLVPPVDLALHHATCVEANGSVAQKMVLLAQIEWMMESPVLRRPFYVARNLLPAVYRRLQMLRG